MFGFSRRRMKIGRLKVQLADSAQGTRSPIRHAKRLSHSSGENIAHATSHSDEINCQSSSAELDINRSTSGNSESWMVLSTAGDKPTPRFNHAAAVIGDRMVVVGGESGHGLLDDVQVLDFDKFTWTTASSKLYLSPTSLPLKIPACKGHSLVSWGEKVLLVGGKTDPWSERISVWGFDTETERWSLMEAKGDVPVARSGHSVVRAGSILILFGGEDAKRRKLNDLHMFDLKSLMWLPLHCTGAGPSPRSNHVAALYDDRILLIFGGSSKSKSLNDLYSLDFETMIWSRIKVRSFHPSPRAGCCGVLCGTKWFITGGGSRKKRHAETLVYDVLKVEWSVAVASPPSSITTNKGFSLVLVQHKEKIFLVAFGGFKKESSNQIEVLIMDKNEQSMGRRSTLEKGPDLLLFENHSCTMGSAALHGYNAPACHVDSVARQNIASALVHHGSGRKSISESLLIDRNPVSGNVSLRKQLHNEDEYSSSFKMVKNLEDVNPFPQAMEQRTKPLDTGIPTDIAGGIASTEEMTFAFDSENSKSHQKQVNANILPDNDGTTGPETDGKSAGLSAPSNMSQMYESKIAALIRKNGILEGQLAAALGSRDAAEKNLSSVIKSRQDMEKKLADTTKEMELLKEKLAGMELAQEETNSLSNIVHSDNVRLEHDVAFLKAVLDDTQKELHSTRGVLAGERARAFQLQVEVFHLKQRLQSVENRAPTPRKPFHMVNLLRQLLSCDKLLARMSYLLRRLPSLSIDSNDLEVLARSKLIGGFLDLPVTDFPMSSCGRRPRGRELIALEPVELKFRVYDGTDIGHNHYPASTTIATLKEKLVAEWPQDKKVIPKAVNDMKLIYAGKFLEDSKTLAESRIAFGELPGGVTTMHVVVQPSVSKKKSDKSRKEMPKKNTCTCVFAFYSFIESRAAIVEARLIGNQCVSDINSALFTHIFCGFADLNPETYEVTISSDSQNSFSIFTSTVQQNNPSIKTLLSIGGGNSKASDFDAVARKASSRKTFIDSSMRIARSYGFHGLNLDWIANQPLHHLITKG
ncbi:hypothetical protein NE237_015368 [Protea cynaroides]|uniref:Ubiquitin-like domain-containing protein n=1 Tax=Protea cynaroides TaxID=273540 RepID=A0A9Q0QQZ3_9MAGN|nr:hypothetical protein NE237_015368 [Protea cynaroides]